MAENELDFSSKKKRDIYSYANPKYAPLRDPMRNVMEAYGEAERFFAQIKEVTWAKYGLRHLTDRIHALEHIQPERVDIFKGILMQYGLEVEYPGIGELYEEFQDLDRLFEICVEIIDTIDAMLLKFIAVCVGTNFEAMARQAEQLQVDNSRDRAWLLEAWAMWDNGVSLASFDNWVLHMTDGEG